MHFLRSRAIADCAKRHGLWSAFSLSLLLLRIQLREHFGARQAIITNLWFTTVFAIGIGLALALRRGVDHSLSAASVLESAVLLATSIVCIIIPLGKVCLYRKYQQQLWLYCVSSWTFAAFLGCCGYFFFTPWHDSFEQNPSSAVLRALIVGGVIIGFRSTIGWFIRSTLQPGHCHTEASDNARLNDEGMRRTCFHEAGHALCYGLCEGVPEDATISIDSDAYNLVLGFVTLPSPHDPCEITKPFLEWQMLVLMAGAAAERHFMGDESIGVSGDMNAFSNAAAVYLMAGYGEVYLQDTKDKLDLEVNRDAISRLRDKFFLKASRLIQQNAENCRRLADIIRQKEFLGCQEIVEEVCAIENPDNDPPLRWPASIALHSPQELC